jgi:hypothetical protein
MVLRVIGFIWLLINGILICIPKIVPICLVCEKGASDPNFIGYPGTIAIGLVSIVLGIYGLMSVKGSVAGGI